ncbi:hypothetical protein KKG48_01605 [Patescibacteria group bacterium]|nr:hypothetical protein [Patescibacteria group bacterium]MCG2694767.1 hypothetical protein [Candidatus Parcubacteria bacterium]
MSKKILEDFDNQKIKCLSVMQTLIQEKRGPCLEDETRCVFWVIYFKNKYDDIGKVFAEWRNVLGIDRAYSFIGERFAYYIDSIYPEEVEVFEQPKIFGKMEIKHPLSSRVIIGQILKLSDTLEETDFYSSPTGKWEPCPKVLVGSNISLIAKEVVCVRPVIVKE